MKRPDWEARLSEYLIKVGAEPFQYGRLDCALFVAGAVEAMTGEDHADGFKYKSLRTGLKALNGEGFEDHFDFVDRTFKKGDDIVVIKGPAGHALGVRYRKRIYCLSEEGIASLPDLFVEKGYAI